MSIRIMTRIWDATFPTGALKLVALKLADCANDDGENIYPSVGRVERDTGLSASAVHEALGDMEASGLVVVVSRRFGNRRNRSTAVRSFDMDRLAALCDGRVAWVQHADPVVDKATGVAKLDRNGQQKVRRYWRLADVSADATDPVDNESHPSGGRRGTPPVSGVHPSGERRGTPPESGEAIEEPSFKTSMNRPSLPPSPPPSGGDQDGDDLGTSGGLFEALRDEGTPEAILRHLVEPIVTARRIGGTGGKPVAAWRDLARAARGLGEEALARAAADVLAASPVKVRVDAIASAIAQAHKSGARIGIQARTPQWAAWERWMLANDPAQHAIMKRMHAWQVRASWPPDTPAPDVEQGAADCWWLSWGTPEHAAALAVLRSRDAAAAQAADMSQRRLEARSRWPQVQAQTTGEAVR